MTALAQRRPGNGRHARPGAGKDGRAVSLFGTLLGWLGVALTGSDTASKVLCPINPPRPGLLRPLPSSCRAPPDERSPQPPPAPALPASTQAANSVCAACCSLWFRYGFAMVSLGLLGPSASAPPHSHCAFRTAHTTAFHHRDAAAPEKVTALLRRKSSVQPSKGLQFNPLTTQAQTSRMSPQSRAGGNRSRAAGFSFERFARPASKSMIEHDMRQCFLGIDPMSFRHRMCISDRRKGTYILTVSLPPDSLRCRLTD